MFAEVAQLFCSKVFFLLREEIYIIKMSKNGGKMRKLCITWVLVSNYHFSTNVSVIFCKACKPYVFASLLKGAFGKVFKLFSWQRLFKCEILLQYSGVRSWLSLTGYFFIFRGKIYDYSLKLHMVIKFVWKPINCFKYNFHQHRINTTPNQNVHYQTV